MQEAPPIKLKKLPCDPRPGNYKQKRKEKKKRDQIGNRKRLIKDLNSPTSPDSNIEPSREFQSLTQAGTKDLENCEVLTLGTSNVPLTLDESP